MSIEYKYPLVTIDGKYGICRIFSNSNGAEEMHDLLCPHGIDKQCQYHCGAFSIATNPQKHTVFVCKAMPRPVVLGYVDYNSVSMEDIQALEHGSDLKQHLDATTRETRRKK